MSDSDEFEPGKKITIKAGYGDAEEQIYEGIDGTPEWLNDSKGKPSGSIF